jgi:monoamine oxidase
VVDVIVIGAGLSGLVAARRHDAARPPDAQGLEVVVRTVLEGRHVAREAVVTVPIGVLPSIAFSPVVHGRRDRERRVADEVDRGISVTWPRTMDHP